MCSAMLASGATGSDLTINGVLLRLSRAFWQAAATLAWLSTLTLELKSWYVKISYFSISMN